MCSKSPNASRCSTIWQTHAVRQWCRTLGLATIHFDQWELGQCVAKSTVLATDLPLRHWTGMTCTHGSHQKPSGVTSSDLSRYPPMMMRGLAQSIVTHTSSQFGPPPSQDSAHSLQSSGVGTPEEPMGGLTTTTTPRLQALPVPPPTEDSAHSLQSSGVVTPVEVKDRPTFTPTSRIQALLALQCWFAWVSKFVPYVMVGGSQVLDDNHLLFGSLHRCWWNLGRRFWHWLLHGLRRSLTPSTSRRRSILFLRTY